MTNKEAIDVINKECEKTYLLLTCSSEFAHALERSINALEKIETVRADAIEEILKKITIYIDEMKDFYQETQDSSFLCAIAEAQKIRRIIWKMKKENK